MALICRHKNFSVIAILLLIGAVMVVWMAAGKVPVLLYCRGIKSIYTQYFLFGAFILTSVITLLIETYFGTVSTRGFKRLSYFAKGSNIFSP
jgi:NhaC family Na+:H+ antiporter